MDAHAPCRLPDGLRLVETRDPALLEEVYALRVRAWRARNANFPDIGRWRDPFDDIARHWVILDPAGKALAAARLTVHERLADAPDGHIYAGTLADLPGPLASINRLVVDADVAGRGLVQALDEVRVAFARAARCRFVVGVTRAGDRRIETAEALGFRVVGDAGPYRNGPLRVAKGNVIILLRL